MATLAELPDRRQVHATGPKFDSVCFGIDSDAHLSNIPAFAVATFEFDGTTEAPGNSFIFATQTFIISNTLSAPFYDGSSFDKTAGSAQDHAERFQGMLLSNHFISSRANIGAPFMVAGNWRVTVTFTEFYPFTGADWLDMTGLMTDFTLFASAGVLPIYDTTARVGYRLFEGGTLDSPLTDIRAARCVADENGQTERIFLDFAGEISGILYPTMPSLTTDEYMDTTFYRVIDLLYGDYTKVDCELVSGAFQLSGDVMVVGSATQYYEDFDEFQYTGAFSGDQNYLSVRPESLPTYKDQHEWMSVIANANQWNSVNGTPLNVYEYQIDYSDNLGNNTTINAGLVNGVLRFPTGGANNPLAAFGADEFRYRVFANPTSGPREPVTAERVVKCLGPCDPTEVDVYFVEPLGNLSVLRMRKTLAREVNQAYTNFYRPFTCEDSIQAKRQLRGIRTYGHVSNRRDTLEFVRHYTDELAEYIRSFRASNVHYVIYANNAGNLEWLYMRYAPDSVTEYNYEDLVKLEVGMDYSYEVNRANV